MGRPGRIWRCQGDDGKCQEDVGTYQTAAEKMVHWGNARMAWEYARTTWEYARAAQVEWENDRRVEKEKLTAAIVLVEDTVLPATAPNYVHSQCVVEHCRDEADECVVDATFKLRMIDGDASIRLVVAVHNEARYLGCGKMPFDGLNTSVKGPAASMNCPLTGNITKNAYLVMFL
ncbi:hypothetical protein DFP73DRAFT_592708 [Morchella snyderi]|nr:hypothetical protein DFP73DRAFT_592708 [Morchella snyderi]